MDVDTKDEDSGTDSEAEKVEESPEDTQQLTQIIDGGTNNNSNMDGSGSNSAPQCWGMLNSKTNKQYILYHRVVDGFKDRYVIGRHSSCDIQVSDKRISSRHCYIYCDYEESRLRVFLEDCSVNGTYVNDSLSRLHKNERMQLKSGDDIYLINPRYVTGDDGNKNAAFLFVNMRERMMAQRSVGVAPMAMLTVDPSRPLVRHVEDDYVIGDEIGKGMSGVVYLCTHRTSGLQCAVKIIDTKKFGLAPGLSPTELREEAQIMKTLNHPNIIRIHDTYETNHVIYIVMELVRGGDLFDSIVVRGRYTEDQARKTMAQIFSAVQYLHNNDIIHRDLKPENILLMEPDTVPLLGSSNSTSSSSSSSNSDRGDTTGGQVRITDFGLAKRTTQEGLKTFCGTPQYFAPEVLKRRSSVTGAGRYGKAADMWSLGVILFILLSGTFPFDEDALFDQIAGAQYSMSGVEWHHISPSAKGLIRGLMTLMPHDRLTIGQAMQHPWLCPERVIDLTGGSGSAHDIFATSSDSSAATTAAAMACAFNPFTRLMSAGAQAQRQKSMGPPTKKLSAANNNSSKKQKSIRSQRSIAGGITGTGIGAVSTGAANKKQRTQSMTKAAITATKFFEARPSAAAATAASSSSASQVSGSGNSSRTGGGAGDVGAGAMTAIVHLSPPPPIPHTGAAVGTGASQRSCIGGSSMPAALFNSASRCGSGSVRSLQASLLRSEAGVGAAIHPYDCFSVSFTSASSSQGMQHSPMVVVETVPSSSSSSSSKLDQAKGQSQGQPQQQGDFVSAPERTAAGARSPLVGLTSAFDLMSPSAQLGRELMHPAALPSPSSSSSRSTANGGNGDGGNSGWNSTASTPTPTLLLLRKKSRKKEKSSSSSGVSKLGSPLAGARAGAISASASASASASVSVSVSVVAAKTPTTPAVEAVNPEQSECPGVLPAVNVSTAIAPTATATVLVEIDPNVCERMSGGGGGGVGTVPSSVVGSLDGASAAAAVAAAAVIEKSRVSRKLTQQKLSSNCFGKTLTQTQTKSQAKSQSQAKEEKDSSGGNVPLGAMPAMPPPLLPLPPPPPLHSGSKFTASSSSSNSGSVPSSSGGSKSASANQKKVRVKMRTLQEMFAK